MIFAASKVSNRDYQKSDIRPYEGRNKHINELQLLTTKGRVWSLTVNEPELIANGGGAQVALKERAIDNSLLLHCTAIRPRK